MRPGKQQALTPLKTDGCMGRVAARVGKACGRPAGALEAFEAGQTAGLNALKNRWLGRVAARVALERPAEALHGSGGGRANGRLECP